jgi:hypothetical protein
MPERKSAEELEAETCSGNTRSFVRPVKRVTRPQVYPQERLRIVLEGFRGEVRVSELCRRGSIARALEGRGDSNPRLPDERSGILPLGQP